MRPTLGLRGGGGGAAGKYNTYITGQWGGLGYVKQRGVITYGISPNRQNPFAGAMHDAVFNTWRRFASQAFYILPPLIGFWYALQWATERNKYLYSKAGKAELEALN